MENITNPAGFWIRFGAKLIDGILISLSVGLLLLLLRLIGIHLDNSQNSYTNLGDLLYTVIVPVIWAGYTIGKRICKVRIITLDGKPLTFWILIKREVFGFLIYVVTLGIGVIVSAFMIGIRQDKRAIHDFVAGTYVQRDI